MADIDESKRVITRGFTVVYSKERTHGNWSWVSLSQTTTYHSAWKYTRKATCTYKYVGLTYTEAQACRAALVQRWTRTISSSKWSRSDIPEFYDEYAGQVVVADISVTHTNGTMYEVCVNLNEQDQKFRLASYDFNVIFSEEDQKEYYGL